MPSSTRATHFRQSGRAAVRASGTRCAIHRRGETFPVGESANRASKLVSLRCASRAVVPSRAFFGSWRDGSIRCIVLQFLVCPGLERRSNRAHTTGRIVAEVASGADFAARLRKLVLVCCRRASNRQFRPCWAVRAGRTPQADRLRHRLSRWAVVSGSADARRCSLGWTLTERTSRTNLPPCTNTWVFPEKMVWRPWQSLGPQPSQLQWQCEGGDPEPRRLLIQHYSTFGMVLNY